jgi:hypothetical protein
MRCQIGGVQPGTERHAEAADALDQNRVGHASQPAAKAVAMRGSSMLRPSSSAAMCGAIAALEEVGIDQRRAAAAIDDAPRADARRPR